MQLSSTQIFNEWKRALGVHDEKMEEIWFIPFTKAPILTKKIKKQIYNTKTPQKPSITQRLQTDLGRSVGVATATILVW